MEIGFRLFLAVSVCHRSLYDIGEFSSLRHPSHRFDRGMNVNALTEAEQSCVCRRRALVRLRYRASFRATESVLRRFVTC